MSLADYRRDMEGCSRCSSCKWVPFAQIKSWRFAKNCPAICRHNFQAYSGAGRMAMGLSLLSERSQLNEEITEIIYRCQLCGACDSACKVFRDDIDLSEVLLELRAHCVEQGQLTLEHIAIMDALKTEDNVLGEPKAARGDWAQGLQVKHIGSEKAEVLFHVGCRFSYDPDLRDSARAAIALLESNGVKVCIAGKAESCCGGRAYELGFRGEAANFADDMLSRLKASGATTLVTACADCYATFSYLYPRMGRALPTEVVHVSQFLERLISKGRLTLEHDVRLRVTYHDPCHLGRMGEPFRTEWAGDKLLRPPSLKRTGKRGVYDAPRNVIASVPGVELFEMERIREYSWCCGAGGGVLEAFPDLATDTAQERIEEALATGARALVTACPWCERLFRDTVSQMGCELAIHDLTDLVLRGAGLREPLEGEE